MYPLGEEDVDDMLKRVNVIEDIDKGHDMFLWRRDGDTGEWFKLEISKHDEKGKPERFDAEPIKKRHAVPILCVTDEAWQFYPNSGGWARTPVLTFYSKQQRKLRDEWYIVTQHPSDVDISLWNIAQDFWMCRNHGMERMGIFRQPSMFRVIVYLTNPAKGNAVRSHEFYRTLDKKLSQCYDTTAGVGIAGGFKGDANQKKSGLHIAWLFAGVLLIVLALVSIPHLLGKAAGSWIGHTVGTKQTPAQWAGLRTNVPPPPHFAVASQSTRSTEKETVPVSVPAYSTAEQASRTDPDVICTGYVLLDGKPTVYFSDGTTAEGSEVQQITKHEVHCFGKVFRIAAQYAYTPALVPSQPVTLPVQVDLSSSYNPPVNDAIILPTIHGRSYGNPPPPRLNGMAQMAGGSFQTHTQGP
jgi:hypothetical protein